MTNVTFMAVNCSQWKGWEERWVEVLRNYVLIHTSVTVMGKAQFRISAIAYNETWYICLSSQTLLIITWWWLFAEMTDMEAQEYFDNFFEEVFTELEDRVITALLWRYFCMQQTHGPSGVDSDMKEKAPAVHPYLQNAKWLTVKDSLVLGMVEGERQPALHAWRWIDDVLMWCH